jgi:hypothetical protein
VAHEINNPIAVMQASACAGINRQELQSVLINLLS